MQHFKGLTQGTVYSVNGAVGTINSVSLQGIDIDVDFPSELYKKKEAEKKRQIFERETLSVFKSYNRMSYDKRYREKYGAQRKKGSDDFLIKLELLLRGVKSNDYTIPEVIFLRDCFFKKIKKDQLWSAEKIVEEINTILLSGLEIK